MGSTVGGHHCRVPGQCSGRLPPTGVEDRMSVIWEKGVVSSYMTYLLPAFSHFLCSTRARWTRVDLLR